MQNGGGGGGGAVVQNGGGGGGDTGGGSDIGAPGEPSHAGDILADLDALQREVDALRGQVGRE